jgi:hypothetical protein
MTEVTATVETIGPDEAKALLGLNTHNRHIRADRVHTMARDMNHGKWVLNGETIKVGETKLVDGQHRLLSVIESGASVPMLVIRGLPDDAQDTVDIGTKRQLSDVLALAGEENAHNLAAAIRLSWYLDNFNHPKPFSVNPSTQELSAWFESNPAIRQSVNWGRRAGQSVVRYPPSIGAALHYLMARFDHQQAGDFWDALIDGTEKPGSPIYALREALLRDLAEPHRMHVIHRTALTIKAWNLARDFKTIQHLGYRATGKGAEDFPVLK